MAKIKKINTKLLNLKWYLMDLVIDGIPSKRNYKLIPTINKHFKIANINLLN